MVWCGVVWCDRAHVWEGKGKGWTVCVVYLCVIKQTTDRRGCLFTSSKCGLLRNCAMAVALLPPPFPAPNVVCI